VFKNVIVFRIVSQGSAHSEEVETALQTFKFQPCSGSQEKSLGWVEPRGQANGALLEVLAGQWIFKFMVETKAVPASVVKRKVQERLAQIEATTGRKPGKKEARDLREDARAALLPMAFTKLSSVMVWIDPQAQWLVIDAASQGRADELISSLVKVMPGLAVKLLNTKISPAMAMSHWLSTHESPAGFSIDRECELKAEDESKAVVRYARHALDTDEISQHIAMGKVPTRVAMTWNERVSFVFTEALQLKKVSFLDVVFEEAGSAKADVKDDSFDADVAIATGELSQLLPELLEALGGELPQA
jgi:recombination associated protein RdgC